MAYHPPVADFGRRVRNAWPVPLPDGRMTLVDRPLARVCEDDVWCDPEAMLRDPAYEQGIALFFDALARAGFCGRSATSRFDWVVEQLGERAAGDLFDWNRIFIDREAVARRPEEERTVCDAFGVDLRRAMNRLRARAEAPRGKRLDRPLLARMCWLSLARKVWLARAGHPEFLEPLQP
ncbi:hypothetical protein SAMN05216258_1153 [Albimonas pacifica]|uniref:Uncharacterized protein n=2 Tax=Albimonas pacifica TaxID=1114924 RepID=A0A1I3NZQ6_9RHOB|nr:hypothetical protein SAMN05216258_1153 [Albimonas pacifica]